MADFFRGLQGGFQTGMQLGQAMRQRRMEDELSKAYGLTPEEQQAALATPDQLARAQAEAQAMQQQDAAEFGLTPQESARYAPAAPQEGARVALPTYTMGGQTFQRAPTQQEIDSARMRAAADVYGRFGDAARREELMRGLRAEERAVTAETRAQKGFETQQEEAGLRIGETRRQIAERENYNNFSQYAIDNPNLPVDELRKAARSQFKLTPEQEEKYILGRLNIREADAKDFKLRIQDKLKGKNLTQLGQLYNTDADFDDKTDLAIVPGKGGAVTLNFIDKASGRITGTQSFKNEALATEYLAKQAVDPLNIGTWLQTVQKNESAMDAQAAQIAASQSTTALNELRAKGLSADATTRGKLLDLEAQYEALTPAQQMGAEGRGLIQRYNMLSAGPGKTVPLGAAPRAERPSMTEAEITSRAKAMVEARERNPDTKKTYTFNEAVKFIRAGEVSDFDRESQRLNAVLGGGSDPFAAPAAPAASAAPAATPAPALRRDAGERNPYVDAQGRPLPASAAPQGAPSIISQVPGAVSSAVSRGLTSGESNYKAYLQSKIEARQPLTADEAIRARRFGLTQ